MGRLPTKIEGEKKKGPWTPEEDLVLASDIKENGPRDWTSVPSRTGLKRDAKSCRLRWLNYLRPGLKRGSFTNEEERIIIQLQAVMGNKWAGIAHYLPGRTDNDVKNYWRTYLKKKVDGNSGSRSHDNQDSESSGRRWVLSLQKDVHSTRKAVLDAVTVPNQDVTPLASHSAATQLPAPGLGSPISMTTTPQLSSEIVNFKPSYGWIQSSGQQQVMVPADDHQLHSEVASRITRVSTSSTTTKPYDLVDNHQQLMMIPADNHQLHSQVAPGITQASTYSTTTEPYVFNGENADISRLNNLAACPPLIPPANPVVLGKEYEYFPLSAVIDPALVHERIMTIFHPENARR